MKKSIALMIAAAMIICGNVMTFASTDFNITVWDSGGHEITVSVPKDATGDVDYGNQIENRYKLKTDAAIPDGGVTFTPVGHSEGNILKYTKLNEEPEGDQVITTFRVNARRSSGYADLSGEYRYNMTVALSDGRTLVFPCTLKITDTPVIYIAAHGSTDVWAADQPETFQVGKTTQLDAVIKNTSAVSGQTYKVEWYVENNQMPQKVKYETTGTTGYDGTRTQWVGSTAAITGLSSGYVTVGVKLSVDGVQVTSWNYTDIRVLPSAGDVPERNYWVYPGGGKCEYIATESSYDDRYTKSPYGDIDDVYTLDSPARVSNITFDGPDASCFSWEKNYETESNGKWRTEIQFKKKLPSTDPRTYEAAGTITFESGNPMTFSCRVEVTRDFTVAFEWDDDQFYIGKGSLVRILVTDDDPSRSYTYRWVMAEGPENAGFASVANAPNDHTITRGPKTDKTDSVYVYGHKEGKVTLQCLVTAMVDGKSVTWGDMLQNISVGGTKDLSAGLDDILTDLQAGRDSKVTVPGGEGFSPDQLLNLKGEATGGAKVTLTPEDGKDDVTLTFNPNEITPESLDQMEGQIFTPAFTPAMPPEAEYDGIVPANGQWVQFAYSGALPAPMTVRMKVDPSFAGDSLTLWRYIDGRMVSQPTAVSREGNYLVFTLDHFSAYAVYPTGFNPNPSDNYVPVFRPQSSSGSSGGGGGSGRSSSSTPSKGILSGGLFGNVSVSSPAAAKAVSVTEAAGAAAKAAEQAQANGEAERYVRFVNPGTLPKNVLETIKKTGQQKGVKLALYADTAANNIVTARMYLDPAAYTLSAGVKTGVTAGDQSVEALFGKYYQNRLKAVKFAQQDAFGMDVGVAVKLDLKGLDTSKLILYSYDAAANSYALLPDQTHFIDANGYLHFTTAIGKYVIVSQGTLA